jgi:hypothetical protein
MLDKAGWLISEVAIQEYQSRHMVNPVQPLPARERMENLAQFSSKT